MANLTPEQAASAAQAAADAASAAATAAHEAAAAAQAYAAQASGSPLAEAAGAIAHAASGGVIFRLSIFVLAIFVGYYVVWSVTPALHTPLMSVTNAISSVIVVGALLAVGVEAADAASASGHAWAQGFGFVGLVLASVNIFGGFLVTSRMLAMYKKKTK